MKNFKILNSKKIKLLVLMSLILSLTLGAYLYTGEKVALNVDGEAMEVVTYSKTVEDLIEKEEIQFDEGAYINVPLEAEIEKDMDLEIVNPKTYILREKDDLKRVRSIHETVEEVLEDLEVELGDLDYVEPASTTKLEENDTINVFRVKETEEVKEIEIPFEKKQEKTSKLFKGQEKLDQKGEKGIKEEHIKKRYVNGELINKEIVKEEVTKEKKDHIVLIGTKEKPKPKPKPKQTASRGLSGSRSQGSSSGSVSRTLTMSATAYTDNVSSQGKWVGQTATGMTPRRGVVAVDPNVIPLGTRLYIQGYGNAIAGDTGGAIKGNRIDLFFDTAAQVRSFGRRTIKVQILK